MYPEINIEQANQLKTWAEQRDAILLEISGLQSEKESLSKTNKELSESNTEINNQINQSIGRLKEITLKEKEIVTLESKKVAELKDEKSTLQSEVTSLNSEVAFLWSQKDKLTNDIKESVETLSIAKSKISKLDTIADNVSKISLSNLNNVQTFVDNLQISIEKLLTLSDKNIKETNVVIEKVPKMLIELQKVGLIRTKI